MRLRAIQVSQLAKIKGHYSTGLKSAQWNYTATYTNPQLARAPLGPQSASVDCHCDWEKQPTKGDHSSLADF